MTFVSDLHPLRTAARRGVYVRQPCAADYDAARDVWGELEPEDQADRIADEATPSELRVLLFAVRLDAGTEQRNRAVEVWRDVEPRAVAAIARTLAAQHAVDEDECARMAQEMAR